MQLMSWPDGERYSCPLQSLVISRIHSSLFSDWRRSVSSKFFDIQVPSISTEKLVLSCLCCKSTQPSVKLLSLQDWQNREFFLQHLQTLVSEHFSSHSALSSYRLCATCSLATICFSTTCSPGLGELPGFGGSMVFRHAPIPWKGSGNNNTLVLSTRGSNKLVTEGLLVL